MSLVLLLLLFIGAALIAIAAIGLVRLPDFYLRTAATTKAITLGVALMLSGAAFYFGDPAVTARVIGVILFLMLTSPVGAHMIGRAAYKTGVPLWSRTVADQWKDRSMDSSDTSAPRPRRGGVKKGASRRYDNRVASKRNTRKKGRN